jgi:hypothetical protein
MEDHTSLIGHSGKLSRKLKSITGLQLHITLKWAVKQKHRTRKSRISFRRQWIKWAAAGGASSVGILNVLQNTNWHDALSASVPKDLSPSRRTWTQSFLGHQKVEHGLQGGRNKKENLDCRTWGMEEKGLL